MDTLLRRPWIPVSLLFFAATGLCIRVAEYRAPEIAARLYAEAETIATAWEREVAALEIPDEANAALLYEKAFRLLDIPEVDWDGIYMNGVLIRDWRFSKEADQPVYGAKSVPLPLPSQPVPEWLRAQLDELLSRNAESLALLYRASTLPQAIWHQSYDEINRRKDFWGQSVNLPTLLLYDALAHILDNDGDGAINALKTLAAYDNARHHIYPPLRYMRDIFAQYGVATFCIIVYGFESQLFSDQDLEALDGLLGREPRSPIRSMQGWWADMQQWWPDELASLDRNRSRYMRTGPGRAVTWYTDRQSVLATLDMVLAGQQLQQGPMINTNMDDYLGLRRQKERVLVSDRYALWRPLRDPWRRHEPLSLGYLHALELYLRHDLHGSFWVWRTRFMIAAERYRRETGAFPERPEQLTPRYLSASQIDNFIAGPFQYERTKNGYMVQERRQDGRLIRRWKYPEET